MNMKFSAQALLAAAAYMATTFAGLDLDAEAQPFLASGDREAIVPFLAERELLAERANREAFALEALCPEGEDPNVWCLAACSAACLASPGEQYAWLISAKCGLSVEEVVLCAMLGALVTTDPRALELGGVEIEPGQYAVGFSVGDKRDIINALRGVLTVLQG